ncbi:MAG: hypothetical protein CK424_02345 [Legionella sp.]|nr:MAG: hypothetical protein CK424_02345 [Legionella sp.]
MSNTYYDFLDITQTATLADIKKAYKKLALRYHPDRPDGDADRFKKLNNIYAILSDASSKKIYDACLASGKDPDDLDREWSSYDTDNFEQNSFQNAHRRTRNAFKDFVNTTLGPLEHFLNAIEQMIHNDFCTEKEWQSVIDDENLNQKKRASKVTSNEEKFNGFKFTEESIIAAANGNWDKRQKFKMDFLRQFDIEYMVRFNHYYYFNGQKYYDFLNKLLNISDSVLSFVNDDPIFIDALKNGVILFEDLIDLPPEKLQLILTPKCITAIKEKIISIQQVKFMEGLVLASLLRADSLEALKSKGQYYRKFFYDIRNQSFSNELLAQIYTPRLIKAIYSFLINVSTLKEVAKESPDKLKYLLSSEFLNAYEKTKKFNFRALAECSIEDLTSWQEALETSEFLEVLAWADCDVTIDFMSNLRKNSPKKWHLMFSKDGVTAIITEELSVKQLSEMSEEALALVLNPSKTMCFGALIHCDIFNHENTAYTFSESKLERMLDPAYVESCLQQQEAGTLHELPESDRNNNPVAYGLLQQINFEALLTQISYIAARFDENTPASHAKKIAATTLKTAFETAQQRFVASDHPLRDYEHLIEACKSAICASKPELEKHRGWKKIGADLINFMIECVNWLLPIGLRFTLFDNKAKSLHQVEQLEQRINQTPIPQGLESHNVSMTVF